VTDRVPDVPESLQRLARVPHLAIALDLDGTLIPFRATPQLTRVDGLALEILRALASAPGTCVAVVSGRPRDDLDRLLGECTDVWLAAEHGVWTRDASGWRALELKGAPPDAIERSLADIARASEGALVERKRWSVCLHYRNVAPSDQEGLVVEAMDAIDSWMREHDEYELLEGASVLEVRLKGAHKGRAIEWLRARTDPGARILALGDDVTDEDAFDALGPDDVAIAVGRPDHPTRAEIRLRSSEQVRAFLVWLARARTGPADAAELALSGAQPSARAIARDAELVVMSNRLPSEEGQDERTRRVGGLVSGVESALAAWRGIWLGWSGRQHEGEARLAIDEEASPPRAAFDLRAEWHALYYNGFANRALWPVLHGFIGRATFREADWVAYQRVNELFAEHAGRLAARNAAIWAHDYHLLLVGHALRARGHRGPIGHFLHVPFPPLDVIEIVPRVQQLIESMLSFDLLGFHTRRYADNFVHAASALTGAVVREEGLHWRGRTTRVGVFPLGVDIADFEPDEEARDGVLDPAELHAALRGPGDQKRTLVLGVDRLDYSKGIPERFDGFARMLELYPEWRGKVSLLQVAVPSRQDVPEYARQRREIETAVGRINGEHGEAHWVPVRYVYRSYARPSLARLYRAAAVGLVTPLRDGMNLVAKEYVAAQDSSDPGVLVLSRFAGAADELDAAILTNPYDREALANDLRSALAMPREERIARHERLRAVIGRNRPRDWAEAFLRELAWTRDARVGLSDA
jgi:alpha,alpha-trehalose-phosphate synthase [UDP-forming]/trehalose-phosphatase